MTTDLPPRQPTIIRWVYGFHAITFGVAYILFPITASSLAAIAATGIPFPVYGAVFAIFGLLLLAVPTWPHPVLCGMWTLWGVGQSLTIMTGELSSPGGIVHSLTFATLHGYLTYQWQRRRGVTAASSTPAR